MAVIEERSLEALWSPEGLKITGDLAEAHVQGPLKRLPENPDDYPAQVTHHVEGSPLDLDQAIGVAEFVERGEDGEKGFGKILEFLLEDESSRQILHASGEHFRQGGNIAAVMPHGTIKDIGIAMFGVHAAMKKLGYEFKTDIMVARTTAFMAYEVEVNGERGLVPISDILGYFCDDIIFTMPDSGRFKGSELKEDPERLADITELNRRSNRTKKILERRQGRLSGLAVSGTSDRPHPDDPDTLVMARVNDGTVRILKRKRAKVLGLLVHRDEDDRLIVRPMNKPRHINGRRETDSFMESMAYELGQTAAGSFMYDKSGLLVPSS